MQDEIVNQTVGRSISQGWSSAGAFFGSIMSGTLLGLLADRWLGTDPWLVVIGSLLGIYSGFVQVWSQTQRIGEPDDES